MNGHIVSEMIIFDIFLYKSFIMVNIRYSLDKLRLVIRYDLWMNDVNIGISKNLTFWNEMSVVYFYEKYNHN